MQPSKFNLEDYGLTPEDIQGYVGLIYKRVSSDKQEDNTSLETQEEECRQVAEQLGIPIVMDAFSDIMTGTVYRERKGLCALRDAYKELARSGKKVIVFVWVLDRISRDQVHFSVLLDEMKHAKTLLICINEKFDDSPLGRMSRALMSFVAEVEHEKIVERLYTGRVKRVERDKKLNPGPKATYGYMWNDKEDKACYLTNEQEAKIIKEIFLRYANGDSMRTIARDLTIRNVPAPKKRWEQDTISYILKNRRYLGEARSFYVSRTLENIMDHKGITTKALEDTYLLPENTIPRLVSDELFNLAQERMQANIQDCQRNGENINSLLRSGFAKCGYCGATMTIQNKNTTQVLADGTVKRYKYPYYVCSNRSRAIKECKAGSASIHPLDSLVWSEMIELSKEVTIIEQAIEAVLQRKTFLSEVQSLEESIQRCKEEVAQYTEDLKNKALRGGGRTVVLGLLSDKQEELDALNDEMVRLKRGDVDYERIKKSYEEILLWCKKVEKAGDEMILIQRRDFLRLLGVKVKVYRRDDTDHEQYEIGITLPGIVKGTTRNILRNE